MHTEKTETNVKKVLSPFQSRVTMYQNNKVPVTVFLNSGTKLNGFITSLDWQFNVLQLTRDNTSQDIFFHSLSSVLPTSEQNKLEKVIRPNKFKKA